MRAEQEAEQPLSAIQRFKNRVHQVKMMHRMGKMLDDKVDEIFDYRDLNAWSVCYLPLRVLSPGRSVRTKQRVCRGCEGSEAS